MKTKSYLEQINLKKKQEIEPESFSLEKLLNTDISLSKNKLSDRNKEIFYGELALLLKAGVDVVQALKIIEEQFKQSKKKHLLANLQE